MNNATTSNQQINKTKCLTTEATNKNPKQLVFRILSGVLLLIIALLAFLRIPYVGEFIDGFIFDLLLFGSAKFFFYILLFVIGILCLLPNKQYWKITVTNRFFVITTICMTFASVIFGIVYYYQNWPSSNLDINTYFGNFFSGWRSNLWVSGKFIWEVPFFLNGGIWWTLISGIVAAAPEIILFIALIFLFLIIVFCICLKLKVPKVDYWRRKVIVWLGGFYQKRIGSKTESNDNPLSKLETSTSLQPISSSGKEPTLNISETNSDLLPTRNQNIVPAFKPANEIDAVEQSFNERTKPFTLKYANRKRTKFNYRFADQTEDNRERNHEFAKDALLKLTDFFVSKNIPGKPVKFHSGPSVINIWWELQNPGDANILANYKNDISSILNVAHFDVYLKNDRLIEFQFNVPYPNKINFTNINKTINPLPNQLKIAIGWNNACEPWTLNLSNYKTMLILGSLGTGKGMLVSSIVLSLITNQAPANLLLGIVDTRSGHLSRFNGEMHLVSDIPNTVDAAFVLFDQISMELKYRVSLLCDTGVKTIDEYNRLSSTQIKVKPLVIVINDITDLLKKNYEYVSKFLRTLNSYANVLSCHLILISNDMHSGLSSKSLEFDFDLVFGFKLENIHAVDGYTNITSTLSRLSGNGDFVLFDGFSNQAKTITSGLACYVNSNELSKIIDELQDQNF